MMNGNARSFRFRMSKSLKYPLRCSTQIDTAGASVFTSTTTPMYMNTSGNACRYGSKANTMTNVANGITNGWNTPEIHLAHIS